MSRRQLLGRAVVAVCSGSVAHAALSSAANAATGGGGNHTRDLMKNGSFEMPMSGRLIPDWTVTVDV